MDVKLLPFSFFFLFFLVMTILGCYLKENIAPSSEIVFYVDSIGQKKVIK